MNARLLLFPLNLLVRRLNYLRKLLLTLSPFLCLAVIFYSWYKARKDVANLFKQRQMTGSLHIPREYQPRNFSLSMGIRIGLFTLYSVATLSYVIFRFLEVGSDHNQLEIFTALALCSWLTKWPPFPTWWKLLVRTMRDLPVQLADIIVVPMAAFILFGAQNVSTLFFSG